MLNQISAVYLVSLLLSNSFRNLPLDVRKSNKSPAPPSNAQGLGRNGNTDVRSFQGTFRQARVGTIAAVFLNLSVMKGYAQVEVEYSLNHFAVAPE